MAFGKGHNGPTKAEPCVSKNFGNSTEVPESRKARVTAIFDTLVYATFTITMIDSVYEYSYPLG